MQATSSVWFVPRSSYAFGAILGILMLYLFMNYKINIKLEKILLIGMIIYILVQYVCFLEIELDHYKVNYLDEQYANGIRDEIIKHEEETRKSSN